MFDCTGIVIQQSKSADPEWACLYSEVSRKLTHIILGENFGYSSMLFNLTSEHVKAFTPEYDEAMRRCGYKLTAVSPNWPGRN